MFNATCPSLIILRGIPGSGKSTLADWIVRSEYHFEADMYFTNDQSVYKFDPNKLGAAHKWCQDATRDRLKEGYNVLVSNTFTTEHEVQIYQDIAKECNANFISLIVENRHGSNDIHNVPDQSIARMKHRFSVKL